VTTGPELLGVTVTANDECGSVCVFGEVLDAELIDTLPSGLDADTTGSGFVGELGRGAAREAGELGAAVCTPVT
jgi:hypothetical protein